jgi:hypothetical protein
MTDTRGNAATHPEVGNGKSGSGKVSQGMGTEGFGSPFVFLGITA